MAIGTSNVVSHGPVGGAQAAGVNARTTGSLGAVLKEEWSDEVTSQFNNEANLFALLDEAAEDELWQGEYYVEPLHTGRNRAGGPGAETHDYPTPGQQSWNQMQIGTSFYRTSGQITSKAMLAAERGEASAIRSLTTDIKGGLRDLIQEVNVDFYGTRVGVLGRVSTLIAADDLADAADVATGIKVSDTFGGAGENRLDETHGTTKLSGGRSMQVVIGTLPNATGILDVSSLGTVSAIQSRTQFTTTAAISAAIAVGDVILRVPSTNAVRTDLTGLHQWNFAAEPLALQGLDELIDDGTTMPAFIDGDYFNIDRSANSQLDSLVKNLGAVPTEKILQQVLDAVAESSGETPDCMLMHRGVRTEIVDQFTGDRRFVPQEFPGGWKGQALVYNPGDGDVHIYVDRHCFPNSIFMINKNYLKRYTLSGAHLVDYDGSSLRQSGSGPIWQWNIEAYFNMACTKPNTCAKLVNVTGDPTFGIAGFNPEF
jgi:hypothetical protein